MDSHRLRDVPSRSGNGNVEVEGIPYHSPYDPLREVQKFYAASPVCGADVLLHFGWGLGYGTEALRSQAKPTARIVVFEPDEDLFNRFLARPDSKAALNDSRFRFVIGESACDAFEDWKFEGRQETEQFLWLEWPAALRLYGGTAAALKERFQRRLRDRAANLLTHFQRGPMYFENAIRNFEFHGDPDAAGVFGRFANVPLIIVSAGPSLDRNIHHLRGIEDRCFILAVDTSLRPLKAAGITPHAAIIADPSPMNARHVVGALSPSTFLFAEQAADASALNEASRRFLFGLGLFPDSLFRKFGVARSPLDVWGSVATAALDLAIRMKANPIIFAGQDFAYSWGRDYASHTIFHDVPFSVEYSGRIQMQDIFGKPIRTTENLVAYRDFFTRKMAAHPHTRFINATEGGILKDGVELLSLQEAVSQACTKTVNVAGALARHHQTKRVTPDALKHLLRVLQSKSEDCDCLREFLDLVAKESVLKDDAAAFGEKIQWAVDLLQRHPVLAGATR